MVGEGSGLRFLANARESKFILQPLPEALARLDHEIVMNASYMSQKCSSSLLESSSLGVLSWRNRVDVLVRPDGDRFAPADVRLSTPVV